jgi:hypothetical protein
MPVGDWNHHYFDLGVEYYVAGRQAASLQHLVSANLLHHALEMFLKAPFRELMTGPELRQKYGHKLISLWGDFKSLADQEDLTRFDELVADLNKWEEVRYPDFDVVAKKENAHGVTRTMERFRSSARTSNPRDSVFYTFCLEEFDDLFVQLVRVMRINPAWLWKTVLRGQAGEAYRKDNRHMMAESYFGPAPRSS